MVHVQYFQMLTTFHFIHNFSAVVSLQFNKTALLFIEKLRKCHFCATLQKKLKRILKLGIFMQYRPKPN